jgi:hypothetical protein
MLRFLEQHSADWVRLNRRMFCRVYPGGMRIASSNYNPTLAWCAGVQVPIHSHVSRNVLKDMCLSHSVRLLCYPFTRLVCRRADGSAQLSDARARDAAQPR